MRFPALAAIALLTPLFAGSAWSQPDCDGIAKAFAPIRAKIVNLSEQIVTTTIANATDIRLCGLYQELRPLLVEESAMKKKAASMGCAELPGASLAHVDSQIESYRKPLPICVR